MTTEREIKLGREAKRILESDAFQQAMDRADEQIIREWREAETTEEREHSHAQQAALPIVRRQLRVLAGWAEWEEEDNDKKGSQL